MALRKRQNTGHWKREHWLPLHGELASEAAMEIYLDRILGE
jgi:hypothetical protein